LVEVDCVTAIQFHAEPGTMFTRRFAPATSLWLTSGESVERGWIAYRVTRVALGWRIFVKHLWKAAVGLVGLGLAGSWPGPPFSPATLSAFDPSSLTSQPHRSHLA